MAEPSKLSPYLPPEIIFNILLRLPTKSLIRFMCVCRIWNATINNDKFIKAHHDLLKTNTPHALVLVPDNESIDFSVSISFNGDVLGNNAVRIPQPLEVKQPRQVKIVSCCNGLVCIRTTSIYDQLSKHPDFAIWNPSIQRLKRIPSTSFNPPEAVLLGNAMLRSPTYGFGYDYTNDDYKFVRAELYHSDLVSEASEVNIYSQRSNSWKQIQHFPYKVVRSWYPSNQSYVNGSVHWLAHPNKIVALNLTTEVYNVFPAPTVVYAYHAGLGTLEGFLYVMSICRYPAYLHDVSIMKEYGAAESWTRLYTIDTRTLPWKTVPKYLFPYSVPLVLSKTGKQVLLVSNNSMICWYDMERKRAKLVGIDGIPLDFTAAICMDNLNLLDGVPLTDQ